MSPIKNVDILCCKIASGRWIDGWCCLVVPFWWRHERSIGFPFALWVTLHATECVFLDAEVQDLHAIWHISCTYFSMNKFLTKWRAMMDGPTNNNIFFTFLEHWNTNSIFKTTGKPKLFFSSHPWEKFPKPRATKKEPHARNHIEKKLKWRKIERPPSCRWWPNDDWTYSGFSRPSQCLSSSLPGRANPWLPIFQARFVQREVVTQTLELKWDIPPQSVYSIK